MFSASLRFVSMRTWCSVLCFSLACILLALSFGEACSHTLRSASGTSQLARRVPTTQFLFFSNIDMILLSTR